ELRRSQDVPRRSRRSSPHEIPGQGQPLPRERRPRRYSRQRRRARGEKSGQDGRKNGARDGTRAQEKVILVYADALTGRECAFFMECGRWWRTRRIARCPPAAVNGTALMALPPAVHISATRKAPICRSGWGCLHIYQSSYFFNNSVALWPPKPRLFVMA